MNQPLWMGNEKTHMRPRHPGSLWAQVWGGMAGFARFGGGGTKTPRTPQGASLCCAFSGANSESQLLSQVCLFRGGPTPNATAAATLVPGQRRLVLLGLGLLVADPAHLLDTPAWGTGRGRPATGVVAW